MEVYAFNAPSYLVLPIYVSYTDGDGLVKQ